MNRESSLYTYTAGDLTYCKCFSDSAVVLGDNNTLISLDTGFLTFTNTYINTYSVTRFEIRNVIS